MACAAVRFKAEEEIVFERNDRFSYKNINIDNKNIYMNKNHISSDFISKKKGKDQESIQSSRFNLIFFNIV